MARRTNRGVIALILAACLISLLSLVLRADNVLHAPFNEDETDTLYHGWRITQGDVMNVHWWDPRAPLPFYFDGFLLRHMEQGEDVVIKARWIFQAFLTIGLIVLFLAFRPAVGSRAGLFSVAFFSAFSFVASRGAQARGDILVLLFTCLSFLAFGEYEFGGKKTRLALSAVLSALAALSKQNGLFPIFGIVAYFVWTAFAGRKSKREAAGEIILFGAFFTGAFLLSMIFLFGTNAPRAVLSYFAEAPIGLFSESRRPEGWTIFGPIVENLPLWLLGLLFFILLHRICFGAQRRLTRSWPAAFVLTQCWAAVVYLIVRRVHFEQDYLLPALVFSMAAGFAFEAYAAEFTDKKRSAVLAVLAFTVCTVVPLVGSSWREKENVDRSVIWHQKMLSGFMDANDGFAKSAPTPENLKPFFLGPYQKVNRPGRTQEHQKLLFNWLIEHVRADDYVLSGDNLPIFRRQAHNFVRTEMWDHLMSIDAAGVGRFSSLCSVEPVACRADFGRSEKILSVLSERRPGVIVLDHAVVPMIFGDEKISAWVGGNYDFVYLEKMLVWVAVRRS